jgi:DNA-binding transcriptional LysR family regulator
MNIESLDLNLLRVLTAIYRTRNVSQAGVALGLSQAATSNALRRLRTACDDPLFVRTAAGMAPTALCESLSGPVREALSILEKSLSESVGFDPSRSRQTFRILLSDAGEMLLLPKLMHALRTEAPHVRIEAVKLTHERYDEALETGDADLALGSLPFLGDRYFQQSLFQDRYRFISCPDHPLFRSGVTLDSYRKALHVSTSSGYADILVEAALAQRKVVRNVHLRVTTYRVACAIVAATELVAIVPAHVLLAQDAVRAREPPFEMPDAEIRQYWHRRHHHASSSRWLRRLIWQLFRARAGEEIMRRESRHSEPLV